jgi:PAS domain S-box-containing protein
MVSNALTQSLLEGILQNMPVMMNAFDAEGVCVAWNRECELVTGYLASEMIGNPDSLTLVVPHAEYRIGKMAEWDGKGDHRDWEWDFVTKSGEKKIIAWANISASFPIPGWASWGIGVDVTPYRAAQNEIRVAHKELEARVAERTVELQAANARLRELLAERNKYATEPEQQAQTRSGILTTIADAVVTIDEKGIVTSFNPAAEVMFGFASGEVFGMNVSMLMTGADRDKRDGYIESIHETGNPKIIGKGAREVVGRRANGDFFPLDLTIGELTVGDRSMFVGAMRDMTKAKERDAAIRQSEETLRRFMESAEDYFAIYDGDMRLLAANQAVLDLLKMTREQAVGMLLIDLWPGATGSGLYEGYSKVLMTGESMRAEYDFESKDGENLIFSRSVFKVGEGVGVVARDISLEKQREFELRESNKRFEDIANVSADWIWETDVDDRFTFLSKRVSETLGIHRDDMIGESVGMNLKIVDVEGEDWQRHFAERKARRPFRNFTYPYTGPNGKRLMVSISGNPVFYETGAFMGYRGTDITEFRRAHEALREIEEKFSKAFDASPAMVTLVTWPETVRIDVNAAWLAATGLSREESIGSTSQTVQVWSDFRQSALYFEALGDSVSVRDFEAQWKTKDGRILDVLMSGELLELDGESALVTVSWDVTAKKRAEREMIAAREEAELANRTKSEFLANVSHELRTPLNAIMGFAQMMESEIVGPITEQQSGYLEDISNSGTYLLDIINDVIDLSSAELGHLNLVKAETEIGRCVDACVWRRPEFGTRISSYALWISPRFPNFTPMNGA